MASNQKEVKVKVATEEELAGVEALELRIDRLRKQKIQLQIDTASQKLEETQARIEQLKQEKAQVQIDVNNANDKLTEIKNKIEGVDLVINTWVDLSDEELDELKAELAQLEQEKLNLEMAADDSQIKRIDAEIAQLDQQSLDLQMSVETGELQKAKAEVEELDNTEINVQMSVQNLSQGISQTKQGVSELASNMNEVQQAGLQAEQNMAFLSKNLPGGMAQAREEMENINRIAAEMPGDDNTMRSVLSTAQALGNNLKPEEMKDAASTMADYMAGSRTMGKQALESQQDIMKYLLDGNTAELERGSIVSAHVDKLKDINTFQERQAAMQQVLNELGYGGIANQDTMLNKQAEWEGMLYNSQDALSSMWLGAEKGAMDYIIKLNDASNGLVGMGIVAGQMAFGPLVDVFGGVAQIGMGLTGLKSGIGVLKNLTIVTYAKAAADKVAAAATWLLNAAMDANPIMLVTIAIIALIAILGYLYFNNEQVRAAIDGLGQSFMQFGQWIYAGAIYWINQLITTLTGLWNYIFTLGGLIPANVNLTGSNIVNAILRVLIFIATLPLQIAMVFANIIARALGFGNNFSQRMISGAVNAVNGFISWISTLPGRLAGELNKMLQMASNFAMQIANTLTGGAAGMVVGWITGSGEHSPGFMYDAFEGELQSMDDTANVYSNRLQSVIGSMGAEIVNKFGEPSLGLRYEDTMNHQLETNANGNTGNTGNTYNFYNYGDIDNEERMNKVLDALIRRLNFENETAGRTV